MQFSNWAHMLGMEAKTMLVAALALLLLGGDALCAPKDEKKVLPTSKIALVIGNAKYAGSAALNNPENDAKDITAALKKLDFQVVEKLNLSQKEMNKAIGDFGKKIDKDTVALFYYAGHGLQLKGKNYLVPIDASISAEPQIRSESIDIETVFDQMENSGTSIVILDACRNNPFEKKMRGGSNGLAQVDAPQGMIIAYSTAPGKTALDGDGRNGVYTQELVKIIGMPNLSIEQVFKRVRASVSKHSDGSQIPWETSSLTGDFYFVGNNQTTALDIDRVITAAVNKANENSVMQIKELQAKIEKLASLAIERQKNEAASLRVQSVVSSAIDFEKNPNATSSEKPNVNLDISRENSQKTAAATRYEKLNDMENGKRPHTGNASRITYLMQDEYTNESKQLEVKAIDAPNGGKLLIANLGNGKTTDYYINQTPIFIKSGMESEIVLAPYGDMDRIGSLKFNHTMCLSSACDVSIKKLGQEKITINGQHRDATVIDVVASIKGVSHYYTGTLNYRFWYDEKSQYLLKQRSYSAGFGNTVKFHETISYVQ